MRIDGDWLPCDDGVVRPLIVGTVLARDGSWRRMEFLVDTGADRTVLTADILQDLDLVASPTTGTVVGLGGEVGSLEVNTEIALPCRGSGRALFRGSISAIIDSDALDMSVLGRDITGLFSVIVDRPGAVVCLIGQRHRYSIEQI